MLVFGAAVLWSLNGALIKLVYQDGIGPDAVTIAFYRSLWAGLFLWPLARGRMHTLQVKSGPRVLGRLTPAAWKCLIFFTLMTVCFVLANTKTEAANAIILQNTSTFWIFGLSPWLLGESPSWREVRLLTIALAGIAIIFAGQAGTDLLGLVVALGAGLFYGLLSLMIRKMRHSDAAAITVVNNLGSALLILPVAALFGNLLMPWRPFLLLILMGIVQFGIPYYLYSLGLARLRAHKAALITMVEPVLVPVWTYLAVGERVQTETIVGGALILLALALFGLSARRRSTEAEISKAD